MTGRSVSMARSVLSTFAAMLAIAGVFVLAAQNTEDLLRKSFASALDNEITSPAVASTEQASVVTAKAPPVAGSEAYWLSPKRIENLSHTQRLVSVGDRISLSSRRRTVAFEITQVDVYEPQVTAIDTSGRQTNALLITAKDLSNPKAPSVQFLLDGQDHLTAFKNSHSDQSL